jgi:hypothetical protein
MSKMTIIEGNSNDKDQIRVYMVKGERGYSAYDLYVQQGGTLTEEEWLDSFLNANNFYNKSEVDDLLSAKADTENLSTVATSGSYNDLEDKPTIPSVKNVYSESTTDPYSADYVNGLNTYLTTETRVGTWLDGRPLYHKTIFLEDTTISSSTKQLVIMDLTDYDVVLVDNFYINADQNSTSGNRHKFVQSITDDNNHYFNVRGWTNNSTENFLVVQTDLFYYINKGYINVRYTKTADITE